MRLSITMGVIIGLSLLGFLFASQCGKDPEVYVIYETITLSQTNQTALDPKDSEDSDSFLDDNDVQPPTLSIIEPSEGSSVPQTFLVKGTAADDLALVRVEIKIDEGSYITASGKYNWQYYIQNLPPGEHILYLRAIDYKGNTKESSITVTAYESSQVPTIALDSLGSNDWIYPEQEITGTASADSGIAHVYVKVDGYAYQKAEGTETWSYTVPPLDDGYHEIYVKVTDHLGLEQTQYYLFQVESTPPMLTITSPATDQDDVVGNYTFEGTAGDDDSGLESIQLKVGDNDWVTAEGTDTWSYTLDANSFSAGSIPVTIRALDHVGNYTDESLTLINYKRSVMGEYVNMDPNQSVNQFSMDVYNEEPVFAIIENNGYIDQLFVRKWNGSSWENVGDGSPLNIDPAVHAAHPKIRYDPDGVLYLTWRESDGTKYQVYCKSYDGSSWNQLGGSLNIEVGQHAYYPDLEINGYVPYIAFQQYTTSGNDRYRIYLRYWDGAAWQTAGNTYIERYSSYHAERPDIAMYDEDVWVAWDEDYSSEDKINVKEWNGYSWGGISADRNYDDGEYANYVSIDFMGSHLWMVWREEHNTNNKFNIVVMALINGSWTWRGVYLNRDITKHAYEPEIVCYQDSAFIGWHEQTALGTEVNVKHWNGSEWIWFGDAWKSDENHSTHNVRLDVDNNNLYIAYMENNSLINHLVVQKVELP